MSFDIIVINRRVMSLLVLLFLCKTVFIQGFDFNEDHFAHLYRRSGGNCDASHKEGDPGPGGGVWICFQGNWVENCSSDHDDRDPDPRGGTWFCSVKYTDMITNYRWAPYTWYRFCNVDLVPQFSMPYPGTTGGFTVCSGPSPLREGLVPYIWTAGCDPTPGITPSNPWGRQEGDPVNPANPKGQIWTCETDGKSFFKWVQKDRYKCSNEHEFGERDKADEKKEWTCNESTNFVWELKTLSACSTEQEEGMDGFNGGYWHCSGASPRNKNIPPFIWHVGCDETHKREGNYCEANEEGEDDTREGGYWHCSGPNPCDTMISRYTWFRTCHNGHYEGEPGPDPNTVWYCTGYTEPESGITPYAWALVNNKTAECRPAA